MNVTRRPTLNYLNRAAAHAHAAFPTIKWSQHYGGQHRVIYMRAVRYYRRYQRGAR